MHSPRSSRLLPSHLQGLDANKLHTFRVSVEVDMTELRRRSLGPLESLGLEAPPSSANMFRPVSNNTSTTPTVALVGGDSPLTTTMSPGSLRCRNNDNSSLSGLIRPAFRLKNRGSPTTTTTTLFVAPPGGSPGQRPWNPATSTAMSRMKREGFAVHDVAATSGGGFYLEPPPLSRLGGRQQGSDTTAEKESGVIGGGGGEGRGGWLYRDYSEHAVFSTGPAAPRFAAFVAGGIQQVSLFVVKGRRPVRRALVSGAGNAE